MLAKVCRKASGRQWLNPAGRPIAADNLADALKEILSSTPDAKIQFCAAEGVSMGTFIHILDTVSTAGLDIEQLPMRIKAAKE